MSKNVLTSPRTLRQTIENVTGSENRKMPTSDVRLIEESKLKYRNFVDTVDRASDRDMERSLSRS